MSMVAMNMVFLGGGQMSTALLGGLLQSGQVNPRDISVIELQEKSCSALKERYGVNCYESVSNYAETAVVPATAWILAVKPQDMRTAVSELGILLNQGGAGVLASQLPVVLSIAAGLRLDTISEWLGGYAYLVRAMPNTPALIRAGITALWAMPQVDAPRRSLVSKIMQAVGEVVWVTDEALLNPVTALSGSGPAYVFYFLEIMEKSGRDMGLPPETVRSLILQTFRGATELAAQSPDSFATLRQRVTSHKGTTAAALTVLEESRVRESIENALQAANRRGGELGDELAKMAQPLPADT